MAIDPTHFSYLVQFCTPQAVSIAPGRSRRVWIARLAHPVSGHTLLDLNRAVSLRVLEDASMECERLGIGLTEGLAPTIKMTAFDECRVIVELEFSVRDMGVLPLISNWSGLRLLHAEHEILDLQGLPRLCWGFLDDE